MHAACFLCESMTPIPGSRLFDVHRAGIGGLRRKPEGPAKVTLAVLLTTEMGITRDDRLTLVRVSPDGRRDMLVELGMRDEGHETQSWISCEIEVDYEPGPYRFEVLRGSELLCFVPFEVLR
ncbi:MAG: hypothetical protein NTV21_14000 [Planctomycetota bacterium]|nr:hypothetical protein [Planctomycetota bacterium]